MKICSLSQTEIQNSYISMKSTPVANNDLIDGPSCGWALLLYYAFRRIVRASFILCLVLEIPLVDPFQSETDHGKYTNRGCAGLLHTLGSYLFSFDKHRFSFVR